MNRRELIKKYLEFFESKGHKIIPSASLVPENDPTVLFTTAGMHPLVPYLLGMKHPLGKRIANVQKCIRTTDIDEVGDSTHHTFFEMLGNWSMGDYFKKEAIEWSFEFLTKVLKIPVERLSVTCFAGDENAPKDEEAAKIWLSLGIPKPRIAFLPKKDNWWGPAGKTGPCGPDTEMFYWKSKEKPPKDFDTENKNWVEIWNDVLMQYVKNEKGEYVEAKQKNVDTGMGVERTVAVLNGLDDNYLSDLWRPIIKEIEKLIQKDVENAVLRALDGSDKYGGNKQTTKAMRIIADHIKAAVFIISDGVSPSNTERGYILRRLIRRAIRYGKELGLKNFTREIAEPVFEIYEKDYSELKNNKNKILESIDLEEKRFLETIEKGMRIFENLVKNKKSLSGKEAFLLYQSYGFPIELVEEECGNRKINFNKNEFLQELKKHQELSRTATKGKFAAGLADHSEQSTKYHTATHMLHKALKIVLGSEVQQMGSNITPERLRFDFRYDKKLSEEQIKKVESIVNEQIKRGLNVSYEEMPYADAVKSGALSYFRERYPPIVKVYTVGNFSKEICTGPHVANTKDMGKFKIIKEESVAQGVRRIKGVLH
ncbi:alanine--tRNA ligase [Candidatus Pacearchaeota archaeon]|nr:alanine--tRNA ligase [Candidatus Pacearchaeota archaeon]